MMEVDGVFLRYASPKEQRTISREDLGFYHAVIIGAIYERGNGPAIRSSQSLSGPLARCIEQHPFLGVTVGDRHTDKSFYQRVHMVNLNDHIEFKELPVSTKLERWNAIEELQRSNLDRPFNHAIPPWRIIILSLSNSETFIAFAWSHMIGDGLSGISLHRSLLEAIRSPDLASDAPSTVKPPQVALGLPFDTPQRLPISWSFLLGPLVAVFFPKFISDLLGLQAQASTLDEGTWTGSPAAFNGDKSRTKIALRLVESSLVDRALCQAKTHDAKLMGLLHQFIGRGMSKAFGEVNVTNFVSQTAVNMRKSVGVPSDQMGEFVSATYLVHPKLTSAGPLSDAEWLAASSSTKAFAETAATLQDQPIGLLRYLPSVRKWLLSKLGQRRDCSHEVSNVGAFEGATRDGEKKATITHVVFSQPGHVSSAPICFNISSVKQGPLVYTVTWPTGALGIPEVEEDAVVDTICTSIQADFEAIGHMQC
ncbi:hypothetical protein K456DRAFT_1766385 [Colletotrichum gloeosporioides 23]|nr:hypothetical protein K456DRAFT_1766385 [Colletotrichum gloeosporioides 23]